MANVHHFKIRNAGKNARIGNVDIRFNLDKQNSTKSNYTEDDGRNKNTVDKNNPRHLQQTDEYEGYSSSDSAKQDETESESETDTDNQYTHLRENLEDALCYTGKLLKKVTSTRKGTKGYKDLKKGMKRGSERVRKSFFQSKSTEYFTEDKLRKTEKKGIKRQSERKVQNSFLQSKLTEYFKKDKLRKSLSTLTSVIKGSSDLMVYGLGSYFDEENSESARQLNSTSYRYSTFLNYAGNGARESLARDGFYHNPEEGSTSTKCFVCGFTNSTWGRNDDVSFVHRHMSPNCTFINRSLATTDQQVTAMESVTLRTDITDRQTGTRTGSAVNETVRCIDLARTNTVTPESRRHGEQLTETRGVQASQQRFGASSSQSSVMNLSNEERDSRQETECTSSQCVPSHRTISHTVNTEQAPSRNMALNFGNNPKHPGYATLETRLRSYNNWQHLAVSPNQLAEAGFFYAGFEDYVRCFYCDGGLRNWEPGNIPMEEHSTHFPRCEFIQRAGGKMNKTTENTEEKQLRRNTAGGGYTDPIITSMVEAMKEMGFTGERALEAAAAAKVNNQTGEFELLLNEAITWAFEHERNDTRDLEAQIDRGASSDSPDAVAGATASSSSSSYTQELASLKAENQRLCEMNKCKICMDKDIAIVFLPCGHLVCCETCAANMHTCPSCKAVINGKIKTVLSP